MGKSFKLSESQMPPILNGDNILMVVEEIK